MWKQVVSHSQAWAPVLIILAVGIVIVTATSRLMRRRHQSTPDAHLGVLGPLLTLTLIGIVVVATILSLPIGDVARGQLLGLLGLLVTGAIALSSTTILGNGLAGIMLRAIRSFRPGDFVRVGEHVGRVSDLGILHTEIQTEDRDLTTLPNLYLVTHPVTVMRASGTVVSAQVSLGYEVSRARVEEQLLKAATRAGLADPFVQVVELGDFSISYRAAGFLTEVKHLITTRSNLRKAILDTLHSAQIEIVSPNFINQRRLSSTESFVPTESHQRPSRIESSPEARIFDKADAAEAKDKMQGAFEAQKKTITDLESKIGDSEFEAEKVALEEELELAKERLATLDRIMVDVEPE